MARMAMPLALQHQSESFHRLWINRENGAGSHRCNPGPPLTSQRNGGDRGWLIVPIIVGTKMAQRRDNAANEVKNQEIHQRQADLHPQERAYLTSFSQQTLQPRHVQFSSFIASRPIRQGSVSRSRCQPPGNCFGRQTPCRMPGFFGVPGTRWPCTRS